MNFDPDEVAPSTTSEDLDETIRKVEESRHVDKRQKWWLFALFMLTLLSLAISGFLLLQAWAENERERRVTATVQEQKQEIAEEAQKALCGTAEREIYDRDLCAKWTELAKTPTPPVKIVDVSREEIVDAFRAYCAEGNCRGANGRTPSPDDVAAAFARFCGENNCQGEPGEDAPPAQDGQDGADAPAPTPEMMLAAVTTYCADGRCTGSPGADGATGAEGPPPSPETIAAAVTNYCSSGACTGPRGPAGNDSTVPGPVGAKGDPGRGVVSMVCQQEPDYSWIVTYSDGTSEPIAGPCRVESQPGPPIEVPNNKAP